MELIPQQISLQRDKSFWKEEITKLSDVDEKLCLRRKSRFDFFKSEN